MMRTSNTDIIKTAFEDVLKSATRKQVKAVKLLFNRTKNFQIKIVGGILKDIRNVTESDYSIDVIIDGRKGSVSGNRIDRIDEALEKAIALARIGSACSFAQWPTPHSGVSIKTFSNETMAISNERLIESCRMIDDRMRSYCPSLYISVEAGRKEWENLLMTSSGIRHESHGSQWNLGGSCAWTRGTDILNVGCSRQWGEPNDFFNPDVVAEKMIEDFELSKNTVSVRSGKFVAVLDPRIIDQFLNVIFMGMSGRNVVKDESPLKERLNEKIFCDTITIVDDPHVPFSLGAREMDSDGVPTQKQTLVANGVLKTFLYDFDIACMTKVGPTGNDGCLPHYPILNSGGISKDAMIKSIDDGIYIKKLLGFGQGNVANGDFSCNLLLGCRIKNGEITGRIKNVMVSGNIYDIFNRNVLLSADTDYQGRFPYALVEGIDVSAGGY